MSATRKIQIYARIAWLYNLLDLPFEYLRYRKLRTIVFDGLSGGKLIDKDFIHLDIIMLLRVRCP